MPIRIVEGLNIPIAGAPAQEIAEGPRVSSVAVLGRDHVGLRPAMRIEVGDRVKLGQPLFSDRSRPDVVFTSPASGVVAEINRGARRALLSVVVRSEGDDQETFPSWSAEELAEVRRDQVTEALLASGLWTALRARPFGKAADPRSTPSSVFVTAIDSNPLAARPEVIIDAHRDDFANGLVVVSRLTDGPVFICRAPGVDLPRVTAPNLAEREFSGPHPSGLVGTHIHSLDPVGPRKTVWHLGYQDVIAIGRLFTRGRLWTERIVSLAGPAVRRPRLIRTRLGASTGELTRGELDDAPCRIISGSVLSGHRAHAAESYLGRYHTQLSVIAEGGNGPRSGWLGPARDVFTSYRGFTFRGYPKRRHAMTSALHGRPTAMVPLGAFERVMPLDILPTQLLRALLVGDTEMAVALGCLELEEEDLALCSFVCPGKLDYGPLLRSALTRIEKEG